MKTYLDQITIYYNPEISQHKKTVAHAESAGEVLAISFNKMPTANNVWTTIYNSLGDQAMQIFDEAFLKKNDLEPTSFKDWYNLVSHNLEHIHAPIAIRGDRVIFCNRPTEIYQLMDKGL